MDRAEWEKGWRLEALWLQRRRYQADNVVNSRLYRVPVVVLLVAVAGSTNFAVKLGIHCSLQVVNQNSARRHHEKCEKKQQQPSRKVRHFKVCSAFGLQRLWKERWAGCCQLAPSSLPHTPPPGWQQFGFRKMAECFSKWALGCSCQLLLASIGKGPSWTFGIGGELDCSNVSKPATQRCLPDEIPCQTKLPKARCGLTALLQVALSILQATLLHVRWAIKQNTLLQKNLNIFSGLAGSLLFIFTREWHKGTTYHQACSWGPFAYISTLAIKKWSPVVFPVPDLKLLQILLIQDMSLIICDLDRGTGGKFVRHQQPSEQTLQVTWCHGTAAALQKNCNSLGCHKDNPLKFVRDSFQTFWPFVAIKRFVHGSEVINEYYRKTNKCRVTPMLKRKFHWNGILCCGIMENHLF